MSPRPTRPASPARRSRFSSAPSCKRPDGRLPLNLRRVGLFSFVCWALFVAAALRFELVERNLENHLRLLVALIGAGTTLFALLRAGTWPRLLYLVSVGHVAFFFSASAWRGMWRVAEVPADGAAETLALAIELAARVVAEQLGSARHGLGLAFAYELAVMPLANLMTLVFIARQLLRR